MGPQQMLSFSSGWFSYWNTLFCTASDQCFTLISALWVALWQSSPWYCCVRCVSSDVDSRLSKPANPVEHCRGVQQFTSRGAHRMDQIQHKAR